MSKTLKNITVKISRFNPGIQKESSFASYNVPITAGMSVLDVLDYIYSNLDSSLSYYSSCHRGYDSCCLVVVNGKITRACTTPAIDDLVIEPMRNRKVLKDLVVESDINARLTKKK
ncbi:MAG: 2Fe-2S iron-sulfur cluster-binding protein [Candidatus Bathyarchaeia archaeon]